MKDIWESLPAEVMDSFSKKYIYGVSFESLSVFLMTLNENIYIEAFVLCPDMESVIAMNKKIIHIEEIPNGAQLLIPEVLRKNVDKYDNEKNIEKINVKVHTIAKKILRSSVYIFGAGEHGKTTLEKLSGSGVTVKGFIDSDKGKQGKCIKDIPVLALTDVREKETIVVSSGSYKEICGGLVTSGHKNVYIDYGTIYEKDYPYAILQNKEADTDILWNLHWHFHILLRDVLQDKIIIYGYDPLGQELKRILNLMDKDVLYFIDDREAEGWDGVVKNKFEIIYEDMRDKSILVTKLQGDRCQVLMELEDMGLKYNADFKDIYLMSDNSIRDARFGKYGCELEPMLGYTFRYPETSDTYDQYIILGDNDKKGFKIMVLGGSTSDIAQYKPEKSWVEYLYEMIHCNDVTIFGGAMGGYNARQECLKLMRDIGTITPNIVISYSGVNDAYPMEVPEHPFLHAYQVIAMDKAPSSYRVNIGMGSKESPAALWFRMEKTMEAMCGLCGCKFYGIFQPAVYGKRVLVGREKMIPLYSINKYTTRGYSLDGAKLRYETMRKEVVDTGSFHTDASLFDLSGLFADNCEEIFKDGVHLYENGNKRVAEEIFKIIEPSLMELK